MTVSIKVGRCICPRAKRLRGVIPQIEMLAMLSDPLLGTLYNKRQAIGERTSISPTEYFGGPK